MALEQTDTDAPDRPDVTAPPRIPPSDVPNVTDDSEAASLKAASATPDASAPSTPSPPTAPAIPDKDPVTAFTDSDYAPIPQIDDKLRAHAQERAQENQDVKTYLQNPRQQFDQETGLPQVPRAEVKERTPAMKLQSNLGLFRDPLFWLGIVGSQFIKKGTGTAMAAATGMMEGFHKGDVERVKLEQEKFKRATRDVLKQATLENSRLAEVWNNPDIPMAEKLPMMQALSAEYGDKTIPKLIQENNLPAIDHIMQAREKSVEHLKKATERYGRKKEEELPGQDDPTLKGLTKADRSRVLRERLEKEQGLGKTGAEQKAAEEGSKYSDEAIAKIGDSAAQGDYSPMAKFPRGKSGDPDRARVWNYVAQKYPNVDLAKAHAGFQAYMKKTGITETAEARGEASSLKQLIESNNALEAFERKSLGDMKVLVDLARKVDATGVPVIEKWVRAGKQATGDPDVQAFHTQYTVTLPELSRMVAQPRLVGQLTDAARQEVREALPFASSVKQLEKSLAVLQGDVRRRGEAYQMEIAKVKKRLLPESFPEPTDADRAVVKKHPEQSTNFTIHFGVDP